MEFNEVILGQPYALDEEGLYVFTEIVDGKYKYIYRYSGEIVICDLRSVGINEWYAMNKITNDHLYVYHFLTPVKIKQKASKEFIRLIFEEYHEL